MKGFRELIKNDSQLAQMKLNSREFYKKYLMN